MEVTTYPTEDTNTGSSCRCSEKCAVGMLRLLVHAAAFMSSADTDSIAGETFA